MTIQKSWTERLFKAYPNKKWVVDGGSLQVISPEILPPAAIITPHHLEFKTLFNLEPTLENTQIVAQKFNLTILLKGEKDYVLNKMETVQIDGGNVGMTKGGTGDVLAGLVAALYCKNEAFLSAEAGSFINKKSRRKFEPKMELF